MLWYGEAEKFLGRRQRIMKEVMLEWHLDKQLIFDWERWQPLLGRYLSPHEGKVGEDKSALPRHFDHL